MGKYFSKSDNKLLDELMADTVTYRLSEKEGMRYVAIRFQPVSISTYKHRHAAVNSDKNVNLWLNQFTRIGFVIHHKKQIEDTMRIQNDSLREFITEISRPTTPPRDNPQAILRDNDYVLKLKSDMRENIKLLTELGLGTPIISALKAKLDKVEKQEHATSIQSDSKSLTV